MHGHGRDHLDPNLEVVTPLDPYPHSKQIRLFGNSHKDYFFGGECVTLQEGFVVDFSHSTELRVAYSSKP